MRRNIIKILAFMVILAYAGKSVVSVYTEKKDTATVTYGNVILGFNTKAYIIKDEMIIKAPFDGRVEKLVKEGERVSKGRAILEIYSSSFDEEKLRQLEAVESELKKQDTNIPFYKDLQKIDEMIKKEQDNYKEALKKDAELAKKILRRIDSLKAKKEEILKKGPLVLQNIESLKEQKEYLEKYISDNTVTINSPEAGIISYTFEGVEDILNTKNMFDLKIPKLSNLVFENKEVSGKVKEGQPVVKIVDNFDWYLAVILEDKQASLLKEESGIKILFSDYPNEMRGRVIKVYKGDDKLYVGIIKMIDEYPDFYKKSKADVEIKLKECWGLKIPVSAIAVENGKEGVWVLKDRTSKPVFKEIEIEISDGSYAIVKGLKIYDRVLLQKERNRGD